MTNEEAKARLEELKAKESRTPEEMDEMKDLETQLGVDEEEVKPEAPSGGGSLNIGG